jgi:diketogulonate reductase-like aldo/keto reductase
MTKEVYMPDRRGFLARAAGLGAAAGLGLMLPQGRAQAATGPMQMRAVPATGELIPVIGMGSWITFNVGQDIAIRTARAEVLKTFFALGGGVVDSSPMYGTAQDVIGWCLDQLRTQGVATDGLFSATKVWTPVFGDGPIQMAEARRLWRVNRFDLMQVHNLVDWKTHLETLRGDKAAVRVRYVGITTSHGSRHREFAEIMEREPLDFVQFTYNVLDREAEKRLLPLAAERGIGVIINRPFRRKALINQFAGKPLPDWAGEIGVRSWPQFLLKFVVSHPAVTCAIPTTSQVAHMAENMSVGRGPMPDAAMRARMTAYVEAL